MGGCVSTSSRSTCSSRSNGETVSPIYGCCGQKRTKRTFSDHVITMHNLPSVPHRIFMNGKSRTSCIFTQQGRKGINQDAMIVWEDFMSEDVTFCGVFDGHGPHGHLVARRVRDALPIKLLSFLLASQSRQNGPGKTCFNGNTKKLEAGDSEKDGPAEDKSNSLWREAYLKAYKSMDKELKSHPNLDCFCSGSTAVTIVKQVWQGALHSLHLQFGEAERIKRCKGRVFALQDEPEVPRVWLPFDDAPGLAMARAFGDFCLKEYGVISIPEFSHRLLTDRDQFIVLASDGVWDVLSNEEVVEIVSSAPTRSSAARILVDAAAREWKLKYPTSKMDDCAVVCLFLDGKMDLESDYEEQGFSSATIQSNHSGNAIESDDGQKSEPSLQRNFTVRSSDESDTYGRLVVEDDGNGETFPGEDQNWSGLEGVTRVNSLVQLPRFSEERPNP
ncbi:putative protein phosphatase 2C 52 [Citrus sinensis]|uniref:Uncharacterized protein n=2 Tax=Citrus sinensis TaxID=2711 RepID=A0ACB8N4I4_CITSI|nr:putative protein phosphatase 2C 52 [Citrus sinensis]KDO40766.1 hypothetical protein CISIN_1g012129mg [Citrus sinensis]